MPVRVFLSHASADKPAVEQVKQFLEQSGDIDCWLDKDQIAFGDDIVQRINEGLTTSDLVLLFLSPASVKSRWVQQELGSAYWEQTNTGVTRLIPVLIGDCQPPPLIANKKYCDLRTNQLEGMRALKTAILKTRPQPATGQPASLPNFVGREQELRELRDRLTQPGSVVPIVGMAGIGKTWLARELIRRHGSLFETVYELDCQSKGLPTLVADLAALAGLRLESEPETAAAELRRYLSGKRCLLLLDNVEDDQPGSLVPEGRASTLITTRDATIPFLAEYGEVKPKEFTDEEALDLFHRVLGQVPEAPARDLFRKLGHLPVALAVAAGLIKKDVHHTVESLAAKLPPLEKLAFGKNNVGRLLGTAIAAAREPERILLHAMAACAPSGVKLDFAAKVAGLDQPAALDAMQGLYARSLVVELDRTALRYRLHPLVREAATPSAEVRLKQAAETLLSLEDYERSPRQACEYLEEAGQAVQTGGEWVHRSIAHRAGNLAHSLGRLNQAYDFHQRAERIDSAAGRRDWLQADYGNQALILQAWGRLEEAMALHKKQEAICQELRILTGLQVSYSNQAVILDGWGRLEEAMALLKKQEAICRELGFQIGVQASYGNQAVILHRWGCLEEAMALHKKEEALCEQLGDRAGLQRSYGNQALILKAWGRLEEAMALHKKEEAICEELGDRAGLQACYTNQALILKAWGRLEEAMALHQKEETICQDLGDRAGLGRSCGNQAIILRDWGRLDEAMTLHKKEETICEELRDPSGLQRSYGNQAAILQARGRPDEALALLKKQEVMCEKLGNRAGLQISYGNQAVILHAWGRLDEAMALHKKEEAICEELGLRGDLAYSYWSQGLLHLDRNQPGPARAKLQAALDIFTTLRMPRERDEVQEALDSLPPPTQSAASGA